MFGDTLRHVQVFKNLYPRNTGYLSLSSNQHLDFSGHMNADDTYENPYHVIEMSDSQSNTVDGVRGVNMKHIYTKGLTFECWMKCDNRTSSENTHAQEGDYLHPLINIYTK